MPQSQKKYESVCKCFAIASPFSNVQPTKHMERITTEQASKKSKSPLSSANITKNTV